MTPARWTEIALMAFEFAGEFDRKVYAEWHQPLLERLFGNLIDLRHDLYEHTHSHRRDHNGGADAGPCTAWPSPPYLAPVWRLIVEKTGPNASWRLAPLLGMRLLSWRMQEDMGLMSIPSKSTLVTLTGRKRSLEYAAFRSASAFYAAMQGRFCQR